MQRLIEGIQDARDKHAARLEEIPDELHRTHRQCGLNGIEQDANLCQTTVARDAWQREQTLAVQGRIYGLGDGLLRDLNICVLRPEEFLQAYHAALEDVNGRPTPTGAFGRDQRGGARRSRRFTISPARTPSCSGPAVPQRLKRPKGRAPVPCACGCVGWFRLDAPRADRAAGNSSPMTPPS